MSGTTLVLDTNLLVLFVVGSTNRAFIQRHKRLKAFSVEDFELLCRLIASCPQVIVTPNTLTETSNLLGHIEEPARTQIFEAFRQLVLSTDEEYLESRNAVTVKEFSRLGLTDAGLLEVTRETRSLLTTDLDLYLSALNRGATAVNFNHLRIQFGTES